MIIFVIISRDLRLLITIYNFKKRMSNPAFFKKEKGKNGILTFDSLVRKTPKAKLAFISNCR
jgi:hypothetical protein